MNWRLQFLLGVFLLRLGEVSCSMTMPAPPRKFRVHGGGLAGLGVIYHLLHMAKLKERPIHIEVLDRHEVGRGGASAVAGGLIHPLSPRGKLVHWGLEGLTCTNALIEQARRHHINVVLREELYRVATDNQQHKTLLETSIQFPQFASWIDPIQLRRLLNTTCQQENAQSLRYDWDMIEGALRLTNGCKVIHVPSYLQGLWRACEELATFPSTVQWTLVNGLTESPAAEKDATTNIYCVGATSCKELEARYNLSLPVQLVRGHSVELKGSVRHALLSGKYISPTADDDVTLIGATHDFKIHEERTREQVIQELQSRTADLCEWKDVPIHRITSGIRVQSSRGALGRRPIVGRIGAGDENSWIFTGLSSRGLLYHGIYGEKLAKAIWEDKEDHLLDDCPDILWWKR